MNGDKSGESGAFLFSRRVPDFCDGGRSFPTNENSNLYRRGRRRPSAMDFVHYQCPKLLCSSPPTRNKHGVSRNTSDGYLNLRQTSGEYAIYRQNLGWLAKSKIPDRLGFSRHMKTRLKRPLGHHMSTILDTSCWISKVDLLEISEKIYI